MSDGLKIVLLLATVLLVFVAVVAPTGGRGPAEAPHPPQPATTAMATPAPNADNVDHAVRAEMQRLQRALEAAPEDTSLLVRMARLLHDAHRPAEAVDYYERYLRLNPSDRQGWLDLADCCAATAAWDRARTAMETLLERFPDDPAALYNLGAIHANTGDFDEARAWWTRARNQTADAALARRAAASLEQIAVP